ncbi:hypothetical protein C8R44DRAFT_742095 [Mycena epipterygia]|nr:hypothetical protein C8R44DRAFT_742095 [Mycena epipterygia]
MTVAVYRGDNSEEVWSKFRFVVECYDEFGAAEEYLRSVFGRALMPKSPYASVNLGSTIFCSNLKAQLRLWVILIVNSTMPVGKGVLTPNSWSWKMAGLDHSAFMMRRGTSCRYYESGVWLAQASYIFNQLKTSSNYEDYLHQIDYIVVISTARNSVPLGYMFLCSLEDLQLDIPGQFQRPDSGTYWSLDPFGPESLGVEEAQRMRLPSIELKMEVLGWSWNESVYKGLRQFHEGKGFEPDSQEVARGLGYPLYQMFRELDAPFAHGEPICFPLLMDPV